MVIQLRAFQCIHCFERAANWTDSFSFGQIQCHSHTAQYLSLTCTFQQFTRFHVLQLIFIYQERCDKILQVISDTPQEYVVKVENIEKCGTSLQCLMVSSPSSAHEAVLNDIIGHLHCTLATIPVSECKLIWRTLANTSVEGASINAIPDLTIDVWYHVEIHLWVCQLGDSKINLDCSDGDGYAVRMLYPTVDLDNVDKVFCHGVNLVKEAIFQELKNASEGEQLLDDMERWSLPLVFLIPDALRDVLLFGAWSMGYSCYAQWYKDHKETKPYTCSQTSQMHKPCNARCC
ncbi:hypothetical protein J3A83DRAFT_4424709 [Scleroderma citrinum]